MSRMVRDRRFHDHVGDAGRIVLADDVAAVDLHLDMQAVVDQQDRGRRRGIALDSPRTARPIFSAVALPLFSFDRELAGDDAVGGDVGVAAGRERHGGIEEGLGLGDHLVAARLVVALAALARIVRDRIGAVEGVVEPAPARIRGVQRIARVGEGHDELRPADLADLVVDIGGLDLLGRGLRQEIADLLQERRIGVDVERLALVGAMPVVDLVLQRVAECEQLAVFRPQIPDDGGKPGPERIGRNPGLGGRLLGDEIEQDRGDLQSVGIDTIHDGLSR